MIEEKTAGQKASDAFSDKSNYCALDIGNEMVKDIDAQIRLCIDNHINHFDQDEFCVVMVLAKDQMLFNMIRRKFYAWPFLPKPRANQTVWLYNKKTDTTRGLWCLPEPEMMATLSVIINVDKEHKNMQRWSNYFFTTKFWESIRKETGIEMLSEEEHLQRINPKNDKSLVNDTSPDVTNPLDTFEFDPE